VLMTATMLVVAENPELLTEEDLADWNSFHVFQREHGRVYDDLQEKLNRFAVFQSNMRTAEQLTAEHNGLAEFGVTRFSDMTPEEFRAQYLSGLNVTSGLESMKAAVEWKPTKLGYPATLDWRSSSKVTAVRDQGSCGSCWSFAATEEWESQLLIKGQASTVLSRQQFIDCDNTDQGCNGGFYTNAWQYAYAAGGVETESQYSYTAKKGTCKFNKSLATIRPKSGGSIWAKTLTDIYGMVSSHGPVAAAVDATLLQSYRSGVFSMAQSSCPSVNHAVLIAGYDSTKGYYIVRNSWGTSWGENGYFRITTTSCAISTMVYGSNGAF